MSIIQITSPIDNSIYQERELSNASYILQSIKNSKTSQKHWDIVNIERKKEIITKFLALLLENKKQLSEQITWQIGRPISQSPSEIDGAVSRATHMLNIASDTLSDVILPNNDLSNNLKQSLSRKIKHVPVGLVFIIAPWNYPYLTLVNTLIPALLAGITY